MDKFGINPVSIIFYTINFFILLFLLNKFLFKPVSKLLEERKKMSQEVVDNLEKSRADLLILEQRVKESLKESNQKALQIIEDAKKSSNIMMVNASIEAKDKSDKILENAAQMINEEKSKMLLEIKSEIQGEVIVLFKKLVGTIPSSSQQKIIDDSIDKV